MTINIYFLTKFRYLRFLEEVCLLSIQKATLGITSTLYKTQNKTFIAKTLKKLKSINF